MKGAVLSDWVALPTLWLSCTLRCHWRQDDLHLSIPMNGLHSISPEALRNTTPSDLTCLYEVRLLLPCAALPPWFPSWMGPGWSPWGMAPAWHEQCHEQCHEQWGSQFKLGES